MHTRTLTDLHPSVTKNKHSAVRNPLSYLILKLKPPHKTNTSLKMVKPDTSNVNRHSLFYTSLRIIFKMTALLRSFVKTSDSLNLCENTTVISLRFSINFPQLTRKIQRFLLSLSLTVMSITVESVQDISNAI